MQIYIYICIVSSFRINNPLVRKEHQQGHILPRFPWSRSQIQGETAVYDSHSSPCKPNFS